MFPLATSGSKTPQLQGATLTIIVLCNICSVNNTLAVDLSGPDLEPFAIGANIVIFGLIIFKILLGANWKTIHFSQSISGAITALLFLALGLHW